MCHQTVSLVQAEIERRGIVTASITIMPEITRRVRPPRALAVPYRLGFPLGEPGNPSAQRAVLGALLDLCRRAEAPILKDFVANGSGDEIRGLGNRRPESLLSDVDAPAVA